MKYYSAAEALIEGPKLTFPAAAEPKPHRSLTQQQIQQQQPSNKELTDLRNRQAMSQQLQQ